VIRLIFGFQTNPYQCAIQKLDYLGLFHLFKLFLRYCYDPEDPRQDLFTHTYVPRSNDFTDLPEYFVRKVSIIATDCSSLPMYLSGSSSWLGQRAIPEWQDSDHHPPVLY
jgi:hypothetical protein